MASSRTNFGGIRPHQRVNSEHRHREGQCVSVSGTARLFPRCKRTHTQRATVRNQSLRLWQSNDLELTERKRASHITCPHMGRFQMLVQQQHVLASIGNQPRGEPPNNRRTCQPPNSKRKISRSMELVRFTAQALMFSYLERTSECTVSSLPVLAHLGLYKKTRERTRANFNFDATFISPGSIHG